MVKRKITETITEYDEKGNIIRTTVTETEEDDDTKYIPYNPYPTYVPWTAVPDITCESKTN